MKKSTLAILIAIGILSSSRLIAQTSGLKAGLWEIKTIKQVMDGKDLTAQMSAVQERMQQSMANLSPDQRAKMESMMGGMLKGPAGTVQVCISAAMAARNEPVVDKDGHCQPTKINRSGNQTSFEINCSNNGRTIVGTGTSVASGDVITTDSNSTITDARGQHVIQSQIQMTYKGTDCQGVTPADQMGQK